MSASVFESPRPDFMRVDDAGFDTEFKPISIKVESHLGRLYHQNVFEEGNALSHCQLCNWIGGTAVKLMPDTSMRQWSVSIDDQKELADLLWSKAIWTLVHVLPIGFMVSQHQFGAQGYTWNPALGPLRNSVTASNSNRLFTGFPISQAVMLKLFPETLESQFSMKTFALIDAFSSKPNTDNPFYNGIRDAIRMTLIRHPYPIPYFWREFILAFLAYNPHDLQMFKAAMKQLSPTESVTFAHELDDDVKTVKESDHQAVSDAPTSIKSTDSFKPKFTDISQPEERVAKANKARNEAVVANNSIDLSANSSEEQRFHREALTELYIQWGRSDAKAQQARNMKDIILYWAKITSEKVQSGKFSVNAPSAFAYIYDDVFITEGGLKRMLALVNDNSIEWQDWMVHSGLIEPVEAVVKTESKKIEMKVWRLRDRVRTYFIPDYDSYTNSDVFEAKSELTS